MPKIVRIRKRVYVRPKQKKQCRHKVKKCTTGRGRRKINSTHLRKWNTRAHKWVVHGRGFWSDFRRGFHGILDPVTKYGSSLISMIPEVGPLLSGGLNAINNIVPRN